MSWPNHALCVSIGSGLLQTADWSDDSGCDRTRPHYARLDLSPSGYHPVGAGQLCSRDELHRLIAAYATVGGHNWIISYRCARVWALAGIWEGLENGTYRISGSDNRTPDLPMGQMRRVRQTDSRSGAARDKDAVYSVPGQPSGYLVTEDPPNILTFRVPPGAGQLTWIDCRNYGVELNSLCSDAASECGALSIFWRRMHSECIKLKLGSACTTAASQAMHGWRKSYMPNGIHAHTNQAALELEGKSYYGGRAECFRLGRIDVPVVHYDVRSMYGHVMREEQVPVRLVRTYVGGAADSAIKRCIDTPFVADVDLDTPEPAYPCRRQHDVIWPVGRFRTSLAGPELLDAMLSHRILRCHSAAEYEGEYALDNYAIALYSARLAAASSGDTLIEQWAKRMLVSLPGKLGQRERRWEIVPEPGNVPPYGEWWGQDGTGNSCKYKSIGGTVLRDTRGGFSPDSIPAVASWITSAARVELLQMIRSASWEHVLYCDTDSLILDEEGAYNLRDAGYILGPEMGALREVYRGNQLHLYGIKHYATESRTVFAGVPRGVSEDCGDGRRYTHTPSPSEEIAHGMRPSARPAVYNYPQSPPYRHGTTGRGGIVSPIRIEEF